MREKWIKVSGNLAVRIDPGTATVNNDKDRGNCFQKSRADYLGGLKTVFRSVRIRAAIAGGRSAAYAGRGE